MTRVRRNTIVVVVIASVCAAVAVGWFLYSYSIQISVKREVSFVPAEPLFLAITEDGNIDDIKKMLERTPGLAKGFRAGGKSALHFAVEHQRRDVAKLLLEMGADPNAQIEPGWGGRGETPLHMAVFDGNLEIIRLLLKHGARVDIKGLYGRTPVDIAIERHNRSVLDLLRSGQGAASRSSAE